MTESKILSLDEFKEAAEEFLPKYFYIAKELGDGARPKDILQVMTSVASVASVKREEKKEKNKQIFGLIRNQLTEENPND